MYMGAKVEKTAPFFKINVREAFSSCAYYPFSPEPNDMQMSIKSCKKTKTNQKQKPGSSYIEQFLRNRTQPRKDN